MCGISGVLFRHPSAPVTVADERQRHRGPDDGGQYRDPFGRAQLHFRRLAIIDLSCAGHQPMSNEDGTVWVVFNGEIYNFAQLRVELERRGHRFRSRTDSEVLVHLWEDEGRRMVDRLNGMFAFCIWDERTGEAFLARDHAGIKPLYLAETKDALFFASEPKTLLAGGAVGPDIDPIALRQYLTFLWVPGERTMWRDVRKMPEGGWLSWRAGHRESGRWWDWDQSTQERMPPHEWAAQVRATLLETVGRQLIADVPLGALLSGGLDSSAIVGAMRALHPDRSIRAYSAHVEADSQDGFADDLPFARQVASRLRLDMVEERLRPAIATLLPKLIWHTDEPLADPAIAASFLLCQRARQDGTIVLLSGQGADELYYGYRSHRAMRLAQSFSGVPSPVVRAASALAQLVAGASGISARATPRRALKMLGFLGAAQRDRILHLADWGSPGLRSELLMGDVAAIPPPQVYGEYLSLFEQSRGHTDEDRWSYVLFKTFMPALNLTYGDRTSMAVSLELRVPYLDRALVEQAGRIPADVKHYRGEQKWILAEAAAEWLPPEVRTRPKTGFGAPLRHWLSTDLRDDMRATLLGERFLQRGFFRRAGVARLLDDLATGRRDVAYIVWALFTFELWARTFVDNNGAAPATVAA
jgi:asparagine synthase (glutamine-hydrolysing)